MSCFAKGIYAKVSNDPMVSPCGGFGYRPPVCKEVPFKLVFVVQWYDEQAEIEKRFLLSYYHYDGTIELVCNYVKGYYKDLDRQKPFLSRRKLENIKLTDLFIGNKFLVLGRHMIILDYGDGITREYSDPFCERAFLLVRPEALNYLPNIIQALERCFRILFAKKAILTKEIVGTLFDVIEMSTLKNLQDQPVAAFFLMAENAHDKLKTLIGEDLDPEECLAKNHQSLRALFGVNAEKNGFYYSTKDCIMRDASFFFSGCPQCTLPSAVRMDGKTTCCIIKPHILREGRAGILLKDVVCSGYEITAFGIFWVNKRQAEEFYEIYQRIYAPSDYMEMVDELAIGPCMVVELAPKNDPTNGANNNCQVTVCTVQNFRQCVGPPCPELAKKVRPQTLRARYGLTMAQNALHCTDLPEDSVSEVEYFFKILDRRPFGVKCVTGDTKSVC